jgi:hypothetical protein
MEEVIFAETENDSYKFVAVILSESSVAKQNDGILQTQSGEPIEAIYYDQYTPDGISLHTGGMQVYPPKGRLAYRRRANKERNLYLLPGGGVIKIQIIY